VLGAEPLHLDLLDRDAVMAAVVVRRLEAIVHQATALADLSDLKHLDRAFRHTNLLRPRGTDALITAAQAAGVACVVAQSHASARSGGW
jgi:nucleoside-diphosphate-sugar epimerase